MNENETMTNVSKLEDQYGKVQNIVLEKDTSKKTPMIRYHLSTETHTIIVSMTIYQAERVNDYIASYEELANEKVCSVCFNLLKDYINEHSEKEFKTTKILETV